MKHVLMILLLFSASVMAAQPYSFQLLVNDQPIAWEVMEASVIPEGFEVEDVSDELLIHFEAGTLTLNLADYGVFDEAHVLAVAFDKRADGYSFSVTVRHRDEGWDHYADAFEISGDRVTNGRRVLLHPHDNEQPFTRSQSRVEAAGLVTISAHDNVHGYGGSSFSLDLDHPALDTTRYSIRFELEPLGE